jgi:Fe-Mn family superoxide dismutase
MSLVSSYKPRQFNLSGLNGISDQTLEMHFKLYEGYVKETNNLTEKISQFIGDGKVGGLGSSTTGWCCTNTTLTI